MRTKREFVTSCLMVWTLLLVPSIGLAFDEPAEKSQDKVQTPPVIDVAELTAQVKRSLVEVRVTDRGEDLWGIGSGFIVDSKGWVVTNHHVIGEARPIQVVLSDGRRLEVKEILAIDKSADLAMLKIEAMGLVPLELATAETAAREGQPLLAMGSPQGLSNSVVTGVLSGRPQIDGMRYLQLAMPIEQGNSGGPVVSMDGKVQGVVTMKSAVSDNLGFAVPVTQVTQLLASQSPIPMSKWLTIGKVNPKHWQMKFSTAWRQRSGILSIDEPGRGFGGRALCLSTKQVPNGIHEIATWVKLSPESGAAGLVFRADGENRHYGFYPSGGALRLSRFDGPDVFSWQVLKETDHKAFREKEWNYLRVRLDGNRIQCFCNEELIIDLRDGQYLTGVCGIAKFRNTKAEFRGFQIGTSLELPKPTKQDKTLSNEMMQQLATSEDVNRELLKMTSSGSPQLVDQFLKQAGELESKAKAFRKLAKRLQQQNTIQALAEELEKREQQIDLAKAALLVAQLDEPTVEPQFYLQELDEAAAAIREQAGAKPSPQQLIEALDEYLFETLLFHGSKTNYYTAENSYFNVVWDDREGLPLTLSMIYLSLCDRLELDCRGIGYPGHFLVRHYEKGKPLDFVDVFNRGERINTRRLEMKLLLNPQAITDEADTQPVTKRAMIVRMLNNLRNVSERKEDWAGVARYVDAMVSVDLDHLFDHRLFRAALSLQAENPADAGEDIQWLEANVSSDAQRARVIQLKQYYERQVN